MKNLIFLFAFVFVYAFAFGQNTQIDSLKRELGKSIEDTNRVNILFKLADDYRDRFHDLSNAKIYNLQAIFLAKKINYPKILAKAYRNYGIIFAYQNQNDSAIFYTQKSIEIYKNINDKGGLYSSIGNLAQIYSKAGKADEAIRVYLSNIKMLENIDLNKKTPEVEVLLNTYMGIGFCYLMKSNYDSSIHFFLTDLKICVQTKDSVVMAKVLNGIAIVYGEKKDFKRSREYGEQSLKIAINTKKYIDIIRAIEVVSVSYAKENPEKAIEMCLEGIKYATQYQDLDMQSAFHSNIADLYNQTKNKEKTLFHAQKVLALEDRPNGNIKSMAYAHFFIGQVQGQKKTAIEHLEKALKLTQTIKHRNLEKDVLYFLGLAYKSIDPKKGTDLLKQAFDMHGEIMNEEREKAIEKMRILFETEKKESENQLLKAQTQTLAAEKQQQIIIAIAIGTVLLLSLLGLYLFAQNRDKNRKLAISLATQEITDTQLLYYSAVNDHRTTQEELQELESDALQAVRAKKALESKYMRNIKADLSQELITEIKQYKNKYPEMDTVNFTLKAIADRYPQWISLLTEKYAVKEISMFYLLILRLDIDFNIEQKAFFLAGRESGFAQSFKNLRKKKPDIGGKEDLRESLKALLIF